MEPAEVPNSQRGADPHGADDFDARQEQHSSGAFDFRSMDWTKFADKRVIELLKKFKIGQGLVKRALVDYRPFVDELRALLRTMSEELNAWSRDKEKADTTHDFAVSRARKSAADLEEIRAKLAALRAEAHNLESAELPALDREVRAAEDQHHILDSGVKELEGGIRSFLDGIKQAEQELQELEVGLKRAENQLSELQAQRYDAEADSQRYGYMVEELQEEKEEQTAKRDRVEAKIAELNEYQESIQHQIQVEEDVEQTANAEREREIARERRVNDEIAAINDTKIPNFTRQINEIRERKRTLLSNLESLKDYTITKKSFCSTTEERVNRQAERDAVNRQLNDLDSEIVRLETQTERAETRVRELQDRAEESRINQGKAEDRARRATAKRQNLLANLNSNKGKLAGFNAELAALNERIERTAAQLREAKACLRHVKLKERALSDKISEDSRRIQAKQAEISAKKSQLEVKNSQLAAKKTELDAAQQKRDQARKSAAAARAELAQIHAQIEQNEARMNELLPDQHLLQEEVQRARKFVYDAELNLNNAVATYENLDKRIKGMDNALRAAESYSENVKTADKQRTQESSNIATARK